MVEGGVLVVQLEATPYHLIGELVKPDDVIGPERVEGNNQL
jgi:hypothetical protein